jgi:hypothetical protein
MTRNLVIYLSALILHFWSILALYYCISPQRSLLKIFALAGYILIVAWIILRSKHKIKAVFMSLVLFLLVVFWFSSIKPKADADYPKHLRLVHAEIKNDLVTIYDVRHCDYRTKDDFDVYYETKTYDLNKLKTVDLFVNYWGIDEVAHAFVSFGFSDGTYLSVSIGIRPEVGETYDMLKGFFKQYELIYEWADERDVVRSRTNYRLEDVYLYRLNFTPEEARQLIIDMLRQTNIIYKKQQFYNTAIQSCTNTIGDHILRAVPTRKFSFWKRKMLTGDVDKRMYKEGWLETYGKSFEYLRRDSLINDRAKAADKDPDFSAKIRTHLFSEKINIK